MKRWVAINDHSRGMYNINSETKFKTSMLKPLLCDHSGAYILVNRTISVESAAAAPAAENNGNKKVIFKKLCSIY